MTPQEQSREQLALTSYLINRVCGRALGRLEDYCDRNYPHDVYFIGNLRSQEEGRNRLGAAPHIPELINKLSPTAFGAEFNIEPQAHAYVHIDLTWSCYYRVFPTYDQQLHHQEGLALRQNRPPPPAPVAEPTSTDEDGDQEEDDTDEESITSDDDAEPELVAPTNNPPIAQASGKRDTLMLRFKKICCAASADIPLKRDGDGSWRADISALQQALQQEVQRVQAVIAGDTNAIRAEADLYSQIRVQDSALASAGTFIQFVTSLRTPVVPSWEWEIRAAFRPSLDDNRLVLGLIFANNSSRQLSDNGKENPHIEPFLFDTEAQFSFHNCAVFPFTINLAPEGFRYDRRLPAQGFNCAVDQFGDAQFVTQHAPVHEQRRYQTRSEPAAPFTDLATDPIPVLDRILKAMEAYRATWDQERLKYIRDIPGWEAKHGPEFDKDRQVFEEEISNLRRGRNLIRDNPDVMLAFRLTNETFRRSPKKASWRLFQIVFLVVQLPGLCSLANINESSSSDFDKVDIIYFPTGGGKTEAYLAVLVFQCFFDRLRGKSAGVTSWIRFPLRLLTLQQTQRVADAIGMAEIVRREQSDQRLNSNRVAGFGVGYFVGKTSTPNELVNMEEFRYRDNAGPEAIATWDTAKDNQARQAWRRLIYCPYCKTPTVRVELDTQQTRLMHICSNKGCKFPGGRIPIYVIDNEIYRYLPTVLVGTIDKLAGVGNQRKMAQIFGNIDGACARHGFFKGVCCQRECDNQQLQRSIPSGLSGPTLFIQDELHLLKEGLGTFDGHYETFTREVLSEVQPGARQKIIASSATIENFARQIEHLYAISQAQARRFPGQGPTLGQSFYAETMPYSQRRYIGIIPHNKTIFNAILELIEYYHLAIQELLGVASGNANPYGGIVEPNTREWFELLDLYVTSTTYFQGNREMNSVRTDLENHVNPILESLGRDAIKIIEMTGATRTDDVAAALEFLERPKPREERSTSVLATQMISHGVDVDRLNAMFFYGMPKQNAEYIQASSRVGRTNIGLVFLCHHPARERDQSHYSLFEKFHQYLGQLVEPVAINRWAKFSINRTLPGLFMGVLLQLVSYRDPSKKPGSYYLADFVRREIAAGRIRPDDFIPILEKAYDVVNANDPARTGFRDEIETRVPQFFDQIIAAQNEQWVSNALIPHPMTSLRDVDDPIVINLDRDGAQWASRGGS